MNRGAQWTLLWGFLVAVGMSGAAGAGPVVYDIQEGSTLVNACIVCRSVPVPLQGSFVLELTSPPGEQERYSLRDLALDCPEGGCSVKGGGELVRGINALFLDVEVSGGPLVGLVGQFAQPQVPWPAFEVDVHEQDPIDPQSHFYRIHLRAAPRAFVVPYLLEKGSRLVEEVGMAPPVAFDLAGTFLLGQIDGAPNPVATFRLDGIDFKSGEMPPARRLTGAGLYRQGGQVANLQSLRLEVRSNEWGYLPFSVEEATVPVGLPGIDVQARYEEPQRPVRYTLRILARPAVLESEFRRGDANQDAVLDVADAVTILFWRFAGAEAPGCLDSADANDDELLDGSDAVYILFHLFLGGPAPPAPGPDRCGRAFTESLGCRAYGPCLRF